MERQESVSFCGIDSDTPVNELLSAKYTKTFAYYTVKERLPVILTKVVDHLARDKQEIIQKYGQDAEEDIKTIIGKISKLKNEVQTNKPFLRLESTGDDVDDWNKYLGNKEEIETQCWFQTHWLYCECYMYRRLWEMFENSKTLKSFDPFAKQKKDAFDGSLSDIKSISKSMLQTLSSIGESKGCSKEKFCQALKMCLWGNRCDLSLSNGEVEEETNISSQLDQLDSLLLLDHSEKVFEILSENPNDVVDFVHDNAAYELFTDLCLSDLLCTSKLASKVRFHAKRMPWYVSDVVRRDVDWLLDQLISHGLDELPARWRKYFSDGTWSLLDEKYWTLPLDFNDMISFDSKLYNLLSHSKLTVFKGDLNYRKLLGDINWPHHESFETALRSFTPTNILSLRTVKCDLICGLKQGQSDSVSEKNPMWMRTGDYGLIQLYCKES